MFELLPQIVFLDGYDQEDNEAPESEEDNGETNVMFICPNDAVRDQ